MIHHSDSHYFDLQTLLEIEPRYPMFGGWRTAFTIGYGLPLQDFLFKSQGKRFLDITFGCPMNDIVIENLFVKVLLDMALIMWDPTLWVLSACLFDV